MEFILMYNFLSSLRFGRLFSEYNVMDTVNGENADPLAASLTFLFI